MLGQRCGPGTAKSTYGTGCFVLLHTGPRRVASARGLLTTVAHRLGAEAEPQFALEVRHALPLPKPSGSAGLRHAGPGRGRCCCGWRLRGAGGHSPCAPGGLRSAGCRARAGIQPP